MKQMIFSPLLFNIAVEVLPRVNTQDKEIKGIQIVKEEVKMLQLVDEVGLDLENVKAFAPKLVKTNKLI